MKASCRCILLVFIINLLFCGVAEIPCSEIEQLSDLKQSMLDYSFEQIEQWKENYQDIHQEIDLLFDDELVDAINDLQGLSPKVAYFFEVSADEASEMLINKQPSLFLNFSLLTNALMKPSQGTFLDLMDVYGIFSNESFHGVSYVEFYYGKELPVMVTTLCEISEGQTIAKTSLVYAYGQYDNEFVSFAGPLLTHFGTELFNIEYYRLSG